MLKILGFLGLLWGTSTAHASTEEGPDQTQASAQQILLLSTSEKEYLAKRQPISYCVDPDWMPFEAIKDAHHIGMAGDYMSLMRSRIPHSFELIITQSWDETIVLAQNRECDVVPFLNKTEKREEYLNFTPPYLKTPQVIVTLDDVLYVDGYIGLAGQTIAVTKGYKTEELVRSKFSDITLLMVETQEAGLQAVSEGRAFAIVGSLIVLSDRIRSLGLANLKVSGKTAFYDEFRVGVRSDDPNLLRIMEKAVASISVTENNALFRKWTAIRFVEGIDYKLLWQSFFIFVVIISFISFYYFMALKRNKEIGQKNIELKTLHAELEATYLELEVLSKLDKLTGLYNRSYIDEAFKSEHERFVRHGTPFSLIFADFDKFKSINDYFGHQIGDIVLKMFADILQNIKREYDIIGRWGGEEFIIICPNTDLHSAMLFAERIRLKVEQHNFSEAGPRTCSFGVSEMLPEETVEETFKRCDTALYKAKESGRNQVKS